MAQQVIINVGVSGAGKSTWTRSEMHHRHNTVRINRDSIRESLYSTLDGYYDRKDLGQREQYVTQIENMLFVKALQEGFSIIVDNTNLKPSYITNWTDLVGGWNRLNKENPVEIKFKIFREADVDTLKKRVNIRDAPLGWDKLNYIEKQVKSLPGIIAYVEKNHKDQIL